MLTSSSAKGANSGLGESPSTRSYFYVGGQYVDDEKGEGQHIFTGQIYVEQLLPVGGVKHPWPLVFIHGAGQTGTVSLNLAYFFATSCRDTSTSLRENFEEEARADRDFGRSCTSAPQTVQQLFEHPS